MAFRLLVLLAVCALAPVQQQRNRGQRLNAQTANNAVQSLSIRVTVRPNGLRIEKCFAKPFHTRFPIAAVDDDIDADF